VPKGYVSSARTGSVALVAILIAGNALVRGGVGVPAIAVSGVLAAACLALAPRFGTRETPSVPVLAIGLAAAVLVIALQLVPLPPGLVRVLSPRTDEALRDALGPLGLYPAWRPLTLDPGTTALELAKAALFAAVAAAAGILGASDRRRDQVLRAVALCGVATVAVYIGAALVGRTPLLEPRVTFVNPNHLAGFLQLAAWPALGFALRARGPARAGWLLAFTFTASGVFLSLSRAGIAAFFVGTGIFAVLRLRANRGDERRRPMDALPGVPPTELDPAALAVGARTATRRVRSRTVAIGGVSAALAVAAWLALETILKEMSTIGDESTTALKLGMWPLAIRMLREFPLVGIGRGAFATAYPAYKWDPIQRTFTHIENEWLQLPVELGVILGVGVIALFAWAFIAAARRRDLSRPLAGALAGAGALVAHNVFDFSLEIPGVAIPFAFVLGIASREMPRLAVRPWVIRAAAGVLLVTASAGLALHRAHSTEVDAAAVMAAATADDAVVRATDALRWHPVDYIPAALAGDKLVIEGRCREAMPWLTRAMIRNPTAPEPHHAAAYCLARSGQGALAKREYRLAFAYGDRTGLAEASVFFPESRELLDAVPDTPDGLLAAGDTLHERPADAADAFRRAWDSFHDVRALAPLASAELAIPDPEEALSIARLLQSETPRIAGGYVFAARALDALERPDEAMKELELGAARLPGDPDVLAQLGSRHIAQRRFSQAKAIIEGIVARDGPRLAQKHVLIARALVGQSRFGEALREVQTARDIAPSDAGVLLAFSRIAAGAGRFDDAIEAVESAAKLPTANPGEHDEELRRLRSAREDLNARRAAGLR